MSEVDELSILKMMYPLVPVDQPCTQNERQGTEFVVLPIRICPGERSQRNLPSNVLDIVFQHGQAWSLNTGHCMCPCIH